VRSRTAELSIGGQRIDKHYQRWWRLYSELYLDSDKNYGAKMTSSWTPALTTVYLPLIFFFNRNPGLALPLIALQYHEVRIDFDLAGDMETFLDKSVFKVWGNYIYLDTEERRRFAQKGHEYLIEQVQHTGSDSVTSGATKQVRLSYNHPVKELVWCLNNGTAAGAKLWNFCSNSAATDVIIDLDPAADANEVLSQFLLSVLHWVQTKTGGSTHVFGEDASSLKTTSCGPVVDLQVGPQRSRQIQGTIR